MKPKPLPKKLTVDDHDEDISKITNLWLPIENKTDGDFWFGGFRPDEEHLVIKMENRLLLLQSKQSNAFDASGVEWAKYPVVENIPFDNLSSTAAVLYIRPKSVLGPPWEKRKFIDHPKIEEEPCEELKSFLSFLKPTPVSEMEHETRKLQANAITKASLYIQARPRKTVYIERWPIYRIGQTAVAKQKYSEIAEVFTPEIIEEKPLESTTVAPKRARPSMSKMERTSMPKKPRGRPKSVPPPPPMITYLEDSPTSETSEVWRPKKKYKKAAKIIPKSPLAVSV